MAERSPMPNRRAMLTGTATLAAATAAGAPPSHADEKRLATTKELAAIEFEAADLDLGDYAFPWKEINDPFLVSLRIAVATLTKSKPELIEVVRALGGDSDDGGDMSDLVERLQQAKDLFAHFVDLIDRADTRLLCATCALFEGGAP